MPTAMLTILAGSAISTVLLLTPPEPNRRRSHRHAMIGSPVTTGKITVEVSINHGVSFQPLYSPWQKEPFRLVPGGIIQLGDLMGADQIRLVSDALEAQDREFPFKVDRVAVQ